MQKKLKPLTVCLVMLGLLCMLTSCGKVQTRRLYQGSIRTNAEVARVLIPSSLQVISFNGASTQEALIEILGTPLELHLLPGNHELGLRYSRTWDNEAQGIERVRSDVVIVPIAARAGESYEISLGEKVETYAQSKRFAANPQLQLVKTGQVSAAPASIMADTVKEIPTHSRTRKIESIPVAPPPVTTSSNLERLREAWEKASPEEQDAFIKSILKR